ncbi:MAG: hypothetical protein KBS85_05195 [Lachnospiraceae bacterium]|nr:hypothetical protein [Candidatus Merdinaster equi]
MSIDSRFEEVSEILNNTPKYKPGMSMQERLDFYEELGSPCLDKRIIHVAGTNGKGSVCSFLRCALEEAGYRTATFVSPHLIDIRERFLIQGEMISKEELVRAYEVIVSTAAGRHISFFDMLFYMFLILPDVQNADFIILETGLGGRLDATNLLPRKSMCIITEIGMDHMAQLGDTIELIAAEKAGIMRYNTPVIYLGNRREESVIKAHAADIGLEDDKLVPVYEDTINNLSIGDKTIDFSICSVYYKVVSLCLHTHGAYQVQNALLAFKGLEVLAEAGIDIPKKAIEAGFARMRWAARMEEVLPNVFVDGAHNEDGIRGFLDSVKSLSMHRRGRMTLLFGVMADKTFERMIELVFDSELFDEVVFTTTGSERAAGSSAFERFSKRASFEENPVSAFRNLLVRQQDNPDDMIFVAGSLYLAGMLLEVIKEDKNA